MIAQTAPQFRPELEHTVPHTHLLTRFIPLPVVTHQSAFPQPFAAKFWGKYTLDGPIPEHDPDLGPCWEWRGALNDEGYAYVRDPRDAGRVRRAHIVGYELAHGLEVNTVIAQGLEHRHRCDNRKCGRPSHIETGTHVQNIHDIIERRRQRVEHSKAAS